MQSDRCSKACKDVLFEANARSDFEPPAEAACSSGFWLRIVSFPGFSRFFERLLLFLAGGRFKLVGDLNRRMFGTRQQLMDDLDELNVIIDLNSCLLAPREAIEAGKGECPALGIVGNRIDFYDTHFDFLRSFAVRVNQDCCHNQ